MLAALALIGVLAAAVLAAGILRALEDQAHDQKFGPGLR